MGWLDKLLGKRQGTAPAPVPAPPPPEPVLERPTLLARHGEHQRTAWLPEPAQGQPLWRAPLAPLRPPLARLSSLSSQPSEHHDELALAWAC